MLYYTRTHPAAAAYIAANVTPSILAAQVLPPGFEDSRARVMVAIPHGTMLTRWYFDCQPPQGTPGMIDLMHMNATDYERDSTLAPGPNATVASVDLCIAESRLPPPEFYLVRH